MVKKSSLILSTVGFLSFTAVQGKHLEAHDFEAGSCSAYYYKDINAAFVDCRNENGTLISRKEAFYT